MQRSFITLFFLLASILVASGVRAEAFIDFYAGTANTAGSTASVEFPPIFIDRIGVPNKDASFSNFSVQSRFDESLVAGVRAGYWFGSWFGMAIDAFKFEADMTGTSDADVFTEDASLEAIPVSVLLLFRLPFLRDDTFPLGRFHTYAGGGPSLFFTDFDGIINSYDNDGPVLPDDPPNSNRKVLTPFSSSHLDPGAVIVAGADFQLLPFVGIFGEYRFSWANASYEETVGTLPTELSIPLQTHHFVGGLTFRF